MLTCIRTSNSALLSPLADEIIFCIVCTVKSNRHPVHFMLQKLPKQVLVKLSLEQQRLRYVEMKNVFLATLQRRYFIKTNLEYIALKFTLGNLVRFKCSAYRAPSWNDFLLFILCFSKINFSFTACFYVQFYEMLAVTFYFLSIPRYFELST